MSLNARILVHLSWDVDRGRLMHYYWVGDHPTIPPQQTEHSLLSVRGSRSFIRFFQRLNSLFFPLKPFSCVWFFVYLQTSDRPISYFFRQWDFDSVELYPNILSKKFCSYSPIITLSERRLHLTFENRTYGPNSLVFAMYDREKIIKKSGHQENTSLKQKRFSVDVPNVLPRCAINRSVNSVNNTYFVFGITYFINKMYRLIYWAHKLFSSIDVSVSLGPKKCIDGHRCLRDIGDIHQILLPSINHNMMLTVQ